MTVVCPAPAGSRSGNRVSAERWAGILRGLGHRVRIVPPETRDLDADLLVALHARKSGAAALRFRRKHPARPLVVALTGTDLYLDLGRSDLARRALEVADAIVTLQRLGARSLPPSLRRRVRTIHQSVERTRGARRRSDGAIRAVVLAHLRPVKDPFVPAEAARLLPNDSRVTIVHLGAALSRAMERRARRESEANPRWRWMGEIPRARARRILAAADLLIVPSRAEGGAHVVGEAAVDAVPILATRIPGNVGLLGARYAGLFPTGDAVALARLLRRFESDPAFRTRLRDGVREIAPLFDPRRERSAWSSLLAFLFTMDVTSGRKGLRRSSTRRSNGADP